MLEIKGYSDLTEIHDGSKSVVFRALREQDERPVIIKLLKAEYPSTHDLIRFKQQYEITKDLDIPGVVKTYGIEKYRNGLALVFEDFHGRSLKDVMEEEKLSTSTFLDVAIRIADALEEIHNCNIIHKDIKPQNILIEPTSGEVKITDFGIASVLSRENPQVSDTSAVEGTIAYMSPEQTGRMNRSVDYRSDLYSLGVTLYEMLTGQLPFDSSDTLELIHAHIARYPPRPSEVDSSIPIALSDIVMRLMAKNAEERYRSAHGLKIDLEHCREQLNQGADMALTPGRQDVSGKFQVAQKLYGREKELEELMDAFNRVAEGRSELMLVYGYPGIGKSALIHEVNKPIARQKGYFVSGKFDQYKRSTPYGAFIQTFQELLQHLLIETEERVAEWRHMLKEALGNNGQVVIDVIPEVELIIGPQPPVPDLPPTESQNRFTLVFRDFVRVFAKEQHPLVVFLDDLQWADSASLKLIDLLITDPATQYLFLIGAYRDNEVSASHPLTLALARVEKAATPISRIALGPLEQQHLDQLVADTLFCVGATAHPLAELILKRTGGNPFFVSEFLKTLNKDQLIRFDTEKGVWAWELEDIQRQDITDNVVDFMVAKMRMLYQHTQDVLKLAACLGNRFDLAILAIVNRKNRSETAAELWEALQEELILPMGETAMGVHAYSTDEPVSLADEELPVSFRFLHDRVQQAAYSLIPENELQDVHLNIGRMLLQNVSDEFTLEDHVFDIVDHLNIASSMIRDDAERLRLAELNLMAEKKAKASAAYGPALDYARAGAQLLGDRGWTESYQMAFDTNMELMECEQLNINFEASQKVFQTILEKAESKLDQAQAYRTLVAYYTSIDEADKALQMGRQALKLIGVKVPSKGRKLDIMREVVKAKWALRNKTLDDILNTPMMTDPKQVVAMNLLEGMGPAAYFLDPDFMIVINVKSLSMNIRYGLTEASPLFLMIYAATLGPALGDFKESRKYWKYALTLNDKMGNVALVPRLSMLTGMFLRHWTDPIRGNFKYFVEGFRTGRETGDYQYASYSALGMCFMSALAGFGLDEVLERCNTYLDFTETAQQRASSLILISTRQFIFNMRGKTENRLSFSDDHFNEVEHAKQLRASSMRANYCWWLVLKMHSHYLFGDAEKAVVLGHEGEHRIEDEAFALPTIREFFLLYALSLAVNYGEQSQLERRKRMRGLKKARTKLERWADACPENTRHMQLLVEAEICRIRGKRQEAVLLYEKVISLARENEFAQHEPIANELAAKCYLELGIETSAKAYMKNARYGYERWGAPEKVKHLNETYPELLSTPRDSNQPETITISETSTSTSENLTERLDLGDMISASQTFSGEAVLAELLEKLMTIALRNAGATRGYLILKRGKDLLIEAEGTVNPEVVTVLQSIPTTGHRKLSEGILNYVDRTLDRVVLNDATNDGLFTADPYIVKNEPKSLLCMPIVFQGKMKGMLYFENNLAVGAFTPNRLELLQLLASQGAMAIGQAESAIDTLTRFWQRGHFMERAEDELLNLGQTSAPCCLMMMDLDHFKEKNDTYGHQTGDAVLRETASRLLSSLRDGSCIGRYGGEEFVLLLSGADLDGACQVAERMRDAVGSTPLEVKGHSLKQTISIGVAEWRGKDETLTDLIARADKALYEAKHAGRNHVRVAEAT